MLASISSSRLRNSPKSILSCKRSRSAWVQANEKRPIPDSRIEMSRQYLILGALVLVSALASSQQRYSASGLVLKIDRANKIMTVSCQAVPGYMDAMAMPFSVRDAKELDGLAPGTMIDFALVLEKDSSHAETIRIQPYDSSAQEPLQVRRMTALQKVLDPHPSIAPLMVGQRVPDFTLTDQRKESISLHQFAGKIVAVDFIYTRCPLPDYCYRFSNNFGRLQKRFADRLGRDLVLLTVTFDPVHDTPESLAKYAKMWKANREAWHFLTGKEDDVRRICE